MVEEHITSLDGTKIGMKVLGQGPGLVLVQGAMGTAASWSDFAQELSKWFTVIVPDRCGRGMSPLEYHDNGGLNAEANDLKAILDRSKAKYIFGLSSGAVVTLYAAAKGLPVEKVIAYEPPFFTKGTIPHRYLNNYYTDLNKGDLISAFYNAGCAVNPKLRYFPKWLFKMVFPARRRKTTEGYSYDADFKELVSSLAFDFSLVLGAIVDTSFLKEISIPTGLFGGAKSPEFLRVDLDAISALIPGSKRVTIERAGHSTMWNYDRKRNPNSDPRRIALLVKEYLLVTRTGI